MVSVIVIKARTILYANIIIVKSQHQPSCSCVQQFQQECDPNIDSWLFQCCLQKELEESICNIKLSVILNVSDKCEMPCIQMLNNFCKMLPNNSFEGKNFSYST